MINISVRQRDSVDNAIEKPSGLNFIDIVVMLFFFAYSLLPAVSAQIEFMLAMLLGVAYLAWLFIVESKWRQQIVLFLGAVALIALMYRYLTDSTTVSTSASNYGIKVLMTTFNQYFMLFFPACLFIRVYTKASYKQKQFLCLLGLVLFSIVIVNTFTELMTNDRASKDWANFDEQSENNVGTYSFVYAVPMVITALTSLLYTLKGAGKKLLVISAIVFMFVFLLSAQYTLALLISIIGIALQISASIRTTAVKLLLWLVFIGGLFLLPTVLDYLANTVQSTQIATRLKELAAFFGSGDVSGYNLNGRMELYWKAIVAFFKSPIIGNRRLGFNPHATLLGVPADIGIIGISLVVMMIVKSKKYICELLGDRAKRFVPVVWCLVLMGLTNPIHSAVTTTFATWILAPIIIKIGDN